MKKLTFLFLTLATMLALHAQVAINTDGSAADNSAMLDIKSNSKGILIPRVTQADIEAINNPANGLMVFNNDVGKLYIYISSEFKWKEVQYGSSEILYPASITIGTGGACANTTVNGDYIRCVGLTLANTLAIDATVISAGAWSIATDTVNGYSFSGNGTVTTTATVQLTLTGHGTPDDNQTDTFTATVNLGGTSSCTFQVMVTIPLCDDNNACTDDSYNAAICSCVFTPVDCDDGNACTNDYCDPVTGCNHTPVDCDDSNACTDDSCDPNTGCNHTPVDCDDSNACTDDSCDPNTGCNHTPVDCDDSNACTDDSCDPVTGCNHTPVDCDDSNACTDDSCDPVTGCNHTPVDCDDGDPNTLDTCDPVTGCMHTLPLNKKPKQEKRNN